MGCCNCKVSCIPRTLTAVSDNLDGTILKHEQTVERRERMLAEYLQQTSLDANPVLIMHPVNNRLRDLIGRYITQSPSIDLQYIDMSLHRLWQISAQGDVDEITAEFKEMEHVYLADGHHRIASMTKMTLARMDRYSVNSAEEINGYFMSVYMDFDEVKIYQFNRLVRDTNGLSPEEFIEKLNHKFSVHVVDRISSPLSPRKIGMYLGGKSYMLTPKADLYTDDAIGNLDVSVLHKHILQPLLGIDDPRTDARITYEGGLTPVEALSGMVDSGIYAVAFILSPTSIEQVIKVAEDGEVMPPKSTWVEPKFLVGLLTNCFAVRS
ncbi:MAG: DUF1015 domain-containing protein [Chitinophagaceae bacterium]|nr:MAG: DUF1015 domain-containing protein [Chitinophagaceae bacterium]